jgi:hypothetical protein
VKYILFDLRGLPSGFGFKIKFEGYFNSLESVSFITAGNHLTLGIEVALK